MLKVKTDLIKQDNKYYYSSDYAWLLMGKHRKIWLAVITILFSAMTYISVSVRWIFLKRRFFLEATTQDLGYQDVGQWINKQMEENQFDGVFFLIVGFYLTLFIIIFIYFGFIVKSYDLYKKKLLLKIIPLSQIIYLAVILLSYKGGRLYLGIVAEIIGLYPFIVAGRLLLPLESRPSKNGSIAYKCVLFIVKWADILIENL